MTQPPLARPVPRLPGESQAEFTERAGVSHETLLEHGIGGIEYLRQLGNNHRIDTDRSVYGGNGYGHKPTVLELLAMIEARLVEEKEIFTTANGVDSAFCKIGAGAELNRDRTQKKSNRYTDQVQYPTGGYAELAGGLTPAVFTPADQGQLLMHGVPGSVLLSVLEAQTASHNNTQQNLKTNKAITSSECLIENGLTEISETNPGCVYARFVAPHVTPAQFVSMMTMHNSKVSEVRKGKALLKAVAKLREAEGEAVPADEQEANDLIASRRKENVKIQTAAAGSAPKKKARIVNKEPAAPRFKFQRGTGYTDKGCSVSDVSPTHPSVVFQANAIYMHLLQVFTKPGAAVKMDELTAANTEPYFLTKMKTLWHHGFPTYTNAPRAALLEALRAFWLAKRPAN